MTILEIISVVGGIFFGGAGSGGLMYWFLQKDKQDHDQNMEISDRLEKRLDKVEEKLQDTESEVDRLKGKNNKLIYQLNVLIKRIELLVNRLDDYDELTEEEKERLTEPPSFVGKEV